MEPADEIVLRTSTSTTLVSASSSPRTRRKSLREALSLSRARSSSMPSPVKDNLRATMNRAHADVRILVIGDRKSGKTSFCYQGIDHEKRDTFSRAVRLPEAMQVVELRDATTPDPFFDKLVLPIFDAFIIIYSVESFSTYMNAGTLYERLRKQYGSAAPVCIFVATHADAAQREVGREYGKELGVRHGILHMEVSSTTGAGVEDAVLELVTQVQVQRKNVTAKELFDDKKKAKSASPETERAHTEKKDGCIVM